VPVENKSESDQAIREWDRLYNESATVIYTERLEGATRLITIEQLDLEIRCGHAAHPHLECFKDQDAAVFADAEQVKTLSRKSKSTLLASLRRELREKNLKQVPPRPEPFKGKTPQQKQLDAKQYKENSERRCAHPLLNLKLAHSAGVMRVGTSAASEGGAQGGPKRQRTA